MSTSCSSLSFPFRSLCCPSPLLTSPPPLLLTFSLLNHLCSYGLSCVESSFKYEVANQFIKLSSPLPTIQATWDIYNFERFYDDPSQQVQTLSGENMNGKEDVDFSFTPSELANTGQFPAGRACGEVRMGSSDSWVKFDPVPHTDPLFEFFCLDDKNWEEPLAGFAAGEWQISFFLSCLLFFLLLI